VKQIQHDSTTETIQKWGFKTLKWGFIGRFGKTLDFIRILKKHMWRFTWETRFLSKSKVLVAGRPCRGIPFLGFWDKPGTTGVSPELHSMVTYTKFS